MLLNEAIDKFLKAVEARTCRDRTVGSYRQRFKCLQSFAEAKGLSNLKDVTPEHLDDWVVSLRRQETRWADHPTRMEEDGSLSDATLAGRIGTAKTFFKWCVERDHLKRSPAKHLVIPELDSSAEGKLIDHDDLLKMEAEAKRWAQAGQPRDLALVRFITETGCRVGEAESLRLSDLKLESCEAKVRGKTKNRRVDFTELTAEALRDWIAVRPNAGHDFVFVSRLKTPLTRSGMYQIFRRLAETAGIEGRYNPHAIRHLVGQSWTDEANLELARQKLGHKHVSTTSKFYAHQDRSRVKKTTHRLSLLKCKNDDA
jgi:site-specific recombinase XerD